MKEPNFKIRDTYRRFRGGDGNYASFPEIQVVQGRKVLARFDRTEQAERWIAEQVAASA